MSFTLPKKWELSTFDEVCIPAEQVIPKEDSEFFYIDISSVDRVFKKIVSPQKIIGKDAPSRARKLLKTGDVIVSMTRPNLNTVALVDSKYDGQIASTGFEVLRSNGIDARWIGFLVRTNAFIESMTSLVQGALYPAIRGKHVRAYQIPVAPLLEQRRIADKLDTVLARVDLVQDRLARITPLLKRFRQSILAAATSGRLTEKWREANEQNSAWLNTNFEEVISDLRYGTSKKCEVNAQGIAVLRIPNVGGSGIPDLNDLKFAEFNQKEYSTLSLLEGDLLIIRSNGSIDLVGKTCVVDKKSEGLLFAGYLIRMRLDKKKINSIFAYYVISSPLLRAHIELTAKSTSGVNNINSEEVRSLPLVLPTLEEQIEIVRRVETLFAFADGLEARLQSAQTAAERLTPALLAKAFRGELVPQDPNDEPASSLLARIANQRALSGNGTKSKQPRQPRTTRAPTKTSPMTKSRQDKDVKGQPYLAGHLRIMGEPSTVESLFKAAQLPVADFYKQLAWEIDEKHVKDNQITLEPGNAAG